MGIFSIASRWRRGELLPSNAKTGGLHDRIPRYY
jgi:hypothetical protein